MILRVARVVDAPVADVRAAAADVPSRAYLAETAAGVLVTLERRRMLGTRRRILRALQHDLDTIRDRCESERNQT